MIQGQYLQSYVPKTLDFSGNAEVPGLCNKSLMIEKNIVCGQVKASNPLGENLC